jgi:hypothetical protein
MNKIYPSNMWEALGRLYLTNSEIIDAISKEDKKYFINTIKKRFFKKIWEKMKKNGENSPPFLYHRNFLLECCKAIVNETEDTKWGYLEVDNDHFIINVNKNLSDIKKRTILAHELGHIFLHDLETKPFSPIYHRERSLDLLSTNVYNEDEGFVYEIGRFLLIPSTAISNYIPKNPSLESFLKGCSLFQTSKDVMAKRLFWDIQDFNKGERYWNTALLFFYSIEEEGDFLWEIPKGNKNVYRGHFFKNFPAEKYWHLIIPLLNKSLLKPDILIESPLIDTKKMRQIKFKNCKIKIELQYIPRDRRLYVLLLEQNTIK